MILSAAYLLGGLVANAGGSADAARSPPVPAASLANGPHDAPALPLAQEPPLADTYCLTCHADTSLSAGFSNGRTLSLYVDLKAVRDSAHELLSCVTCHDKYEPPPPERTEPYDFAVYQGEATAMCARCHTAAAEGYAGSVHSQAVIEEGNGATCIECHSPDASGHSIARTSEPALFLGAERIADACGRCHEKALSSYRDTSHGKVDRFGDAKQTAGCTTCHADHAVQPAQDLLVSSSISPLATICSDCHDGAGESFARAWPGHSSGAPSGSSANVAGRAGFFVAAAIVAFGLVHISLDLLRRRVGPRGGAK